MNKSKHKTQGTRYKVQGFFLASCPLIELLAIRLRWRTTPAKSLVMPLASVQRGFSLISAIFLLVVIAALGTFAVTLFTTQQQSAAMDVLGARAYQASKAGIEWGAYQVLKNGGCPASPTVLSALPNTLANFSVQVDCLSTPVSEASATITIYQLTSTATQGTTVGTPDYIQRQMSVTIAQ
jgi:MSHA biogenesis protein MshP